MLTWHDVGETEGPLSLSGGPSFAHERSASRLLVDVRHELHWLTKVTQAQD